MCLAPVMIKSIVLNFNEQGNVAFRRSQFDAAIQHYKNAHEIEPELPYYQLNLAAAHLKLSK